MIGKINGEYLPGGKDMKVGDLIKYERTFRSVPMAFGLIVRINKQHITVLRFNGSLKTWTIRKGMEVINEDW